MMKQSLSARLAVSYLLVILVVLIVAIPLAWLAVERLYLNTQRENLLAQAQLVADTLRTKSPSSAIRSPMRRPPTFCPASIPA